MGIAQSFITSLEDITTQRLNHLLMGSAILLTGQVTDVQVEQDLTPPMSNLACILKLKYSNDAQGKLPGTVFFKNGRMFGEVSFAQQVASMLPHPSIVECYSAVFENELGQSNLIFEDIQSSHRFINSHGKFTESELAHLVTTLADFHRAGWEHGELASEGKIGRSANDLPNNLALPRAKQALEPFFENVGNTIHKERYEKIFKKLPHPAWTQRRNNISSMTVVHGDVHHGNTAFPLSNKASLKLLDWSLWHIDLPTYDLAYVLALHTSAEFRNNHEGDLLKKYHAALGLDTYSFEQLQDDYRLSILFHTIWPVFFHSFTPKERWMPLHENIMQAVEDWECEKLIG